jgi:hypothetical protein
LPPFWGWAAIAPQLLRHGAKPSAARKQRQPMRCYITPISAKRRITLIIVNRPIAENKVTATKSGLEIASAIRDRTVAGKIA